MLHFLKIYLRKRANKRNGGHSSATGALRHTWLPGLRSIGIILTIMVAHTAAMMQFENLGLQDSVWLTATSITTVGYGDLSASTLPGRLSTILILYVGGIFVLGKAAGDFFDYRSMRRESIRQGNWNWNKMKNHIVIIGSKQDQRQHLERLIAECVRNEVTADKEIVLISCGFPDGLPASWDGFNIHFVNGYGSDPDSLKRAGLETAAIVILLAWDGQDARSDGVAFDVINRITDLNSQVTIVSECVEDTNRQRLKNAGASLVLRPIRAYPEMIVSGIASPGATIILENLFTMEGERIRREDRDFSGSWKEVVTEYLEADLGIAIAYRRRNTDTIITAPSAHEQVQADAVFLLGS